MQELARALKSAGLKQQEVASNLDYLIQKGWVCEVIANRTFTTPQGTVRQNEKRSYKISDAGIDRLEAASTYQRPETTPHVNITNVHGVTVLGNGNVVNTNFTDLTHVLNEMRQAVLNAPHVPDDQKLDIAADIDSLQGQLQKPAPHRTIVKTLWSGIEKAVTGAGFMDLLAKAGALVGPLLS
jgi:hypothetical protein